MEEGGAGRLPDRENKEPKKDGVGDECNDATSGWITGGGL